MFYHLEPGASKPTRAHDDDGCYDIRAISGPIITTTDGGAINVLYDTGIRIALPPGWHVLIFPRSSVTKTPLVLGNSVGYVDNGYRGKLFINFKYLGNVPLPLNEYLPAVGDRIAQITFIQSPKTKYFKADSETDLPSTIRGEKGWGSSGK